MRKPKFVVYKDKHHEWRWRLVAGNNKIIAEGGEGYRKRRACLLMRLTVMETIIKSVVVEQSK